MIYGVPHMLMFSCLRRQFTVQGTNSTFPLRQNGDGSGKEKKESPEREKEQGSISSSFRLVL